MKKTILIIIICLFLAASWVLLFVVGKDSKQVSVYETTYMDLKNSIELSGKVVSRNIYTISTNASGKVESINFESGDMVLKDDTLIELKNDILTSELKKAKLELASLEKAHNQNAILTNTSDSLSLEKEKSIVLAQTCGISLHALNSIFQESAPVLSNDAVIQNFDDNQTEIAKLSIESLQKSIDSLNVKSPISGKIISVNCSNGQYLTSYFPAAVIADVNDLYIEAIAFEHDADKLYENVETNITTNEGKNIKGHIEKVGSLSSVQSSDYQTNNTVAKIDVQPEHPLELTLGSTVDLDIILDSRQNVLAIPVDCIIDSSYVYVVENGFTKRKKIKTGFTDGYYIEIVSGLSKNDQVILNPSDIQDKEKVSVHDKN